jgi:microcin C transport system substrate-binding protein
MISIKKFLIKFSLILFLFKSHANAEQLECLEGYICSHNLIMFASEDDYKNQEKFEYFDYVNPKAPKGGEIKYASIGTFDSFNRFILKGIPAAGIGRIYDSLMVGSSNDIFVKHPKLAEYVMLGEDKKSIIFVLNSKARWHDGKKITADDVVFTFNTLMEKGNPFFASYYSDIESVEKLGELKVRFNFKTSDNRELPFIVSELTIIPKHYYEVNDFEKTTLDPPLGSGAYKVKDFKPGRQIRYERVEDYWGKDLSVNIGRNNFDIITHEYFKDATIAVEAFKAGTYDFRQENIAKNWAEAYNIKQVEEGDIIKEKIPHDLPTGIQSYILNLRKEKFQDEKVRKALTLAFDFEWTNKTLFYNSYERVRSYFSNSIYEADGLPEGKELEILEKFKGKIPDTVFNEEYNPPKSDGSGKNRNNLLKARELLKQAGYKIKQGKLHNSIGKVFKIEFMLNSPSMERVTMPYVENLKRLGFDASIRIIDPAQYVERAEQFDYDVIVTSFGSSQLPGNELYNKFHSSKAEVPGSGNYMGLKNEVVDQLIDKIVKAQDKETLIAATKALDRVLQHGHYVIPQWTITAFRVIYWNKFEKPEKAPRYSLGVDSWWSKE